MIPPNSSFFEKIGGCPSAMWNGWRNYAKRASFRKGITPKTQEKTSPAVMILYGGGETNLCNVHHAELANHMAKHLWKEHAVLAPVEPVAALTDAISMGHAYKNEPRLGAMGYSLMSREIFAFSVVQQVEINRVDAIIIITGCDKSVAGGMLAASWLKHMPVVLLHGGTIRAGCTLAGERIHIETANEASGMLKVGKINESEHDEILEKSLPSPGGCGVMATSNTLACMASILGMSVLSSASTPAMALDHSSIHPEKLREGEKAAETVLRMFCVGKKLEDIVDPRSFANASVMLHAIGGSTNAVIHLPAIAEGFEIEFTLRNIQETQKTPVLLNLLPAGKFIMEDLFEKADGFASLTKYMLQNGLIDGSARTVESDNLAQGVESAPLPDFAAGDEAIIRPIENPVKPQSSLFVVQGDHSNKKEVSIAPDGSVFKLSGKRKGFEGPAKIFDFEDKAIQALMNDEIQAGDVIVLRYQGVSVGCPELLRLTAALTGMGLDDQIAVVTDGRLSGVSRGTLAVHCEPEAWRGGPIALIEDGDVVQLDGDNASLVVKVSQEEIEKRRSRWTRPTITLPRGPMRVVMQVIQPLHKGAIWW